MPIVGGDRQNPGGKGYQQSSRLVLRRVVRILRPHIIVSGSSSAETVGSRGHMAMISTGRGFTVHALAL